MAQEQNTSANELLKKGFHLLKPCTRKLIGFLSHQDPRLKEEGAKALGKIGDPEAIVPLYEGILKEKQDSSMPEALASIADETAFKNLLKAFNESEKEIRPNIALALGNFKNKEAVTLLISGLNDLDSNVRYACITALGRIKDMSAVSPILGCLGESNEWLFLNVVDALAKIHSHKATNPLVAFYLRERNERKRASIINALGQLGDLTAVATLTRALRDPDDRVKANAIESISKLGLPTDKIFSLIQPFFSHSSNRVRGNALVAAARIGKTSELSKQLRSMSEDNNKWVRATLGYILSVIDSPDTMEYLDCLLKDNEPDVRKTAAKAFMLRAKEAETETVIKMLSDSAPFVRLQAITILGKLRASATSELLIKMLDNERNPKLRASIISSLGHMGGKEACFILQSALHDRDSRVRANAVEGLDEILGDDCINIIRPLLHDSDNRTKANVARILFKHGETEIIKELESMLTSRDISMKISAVYATSQLGIILNELVKVPVHSDLSSKIEKVVLPVVPQIARAVFTESATAPVMTASYAHEPGNGSNPLPVAEKSSSQIREELRTRYESDFNVGKLKEALETVELFLTKFPYDLKGLTFAGNLYFKMSRFSDAIKIFNRILEMNQFSVQALSNLGTAYFREGQIDNAIESYKKVLKLKPDLSAIRFNLASIYLKCAKWPEAIRQYEDGLRYQQPTSRVLNNLALAYQKTGDTEKASEIYRKVLVLDSKDAGAFYNLALILNRKGKTLEALQLIRRSLNSVEANSPGYKTLSDFHERLSAKCHLR